MRKTILLFLLFSFAFSPIAKSYNGNNIRLTKIISEDEDTIKNDEEVYSVVECMPSFPGNVNQWLSANVVYPDAAAKNDIQGKVFIKFVVRKDGTITNVEVMRSIDSLLDNEAIRVIKLMPKWRPGYNNGIPVSCWFVLPITFRFSSTDK